MTVEYRSIDAPVDFYTFEAIKDLYANAGWPISMTILL